MALDASLQNSKKVVDPKLKLESDFTNRALVTLPGSIKTVSKEAPPSHHQQSNGHHP